MACHSSAGCKNALGGVHALNILRTGLAADKYDRHSLCLFFGLFRREAYGSAGGARGCRKPLCNRLCLFQSLAVKLRVQESVQLLRVNHKHSLFLGAHTLSHKVDRYFKCGVSRSLAVSRLKHIELTLLKGKFHVLHIFKVNLKRICDMYKFFIRFRIYLFKLIDCLGRSYAGNNVFALSVHEELAEQLLFAGSRVACKRNACSGIVAHIAEYHHLNVYSRTPVVRDIVHLSVNDGPWVVPAAEYGLYGRNKLFLRIRREISTQFFLVEGLEANYKLTHVSLVKLGVEIDFLGEFDVVDDVLEFRFRKLHNDVRKHLNKSAVTVIGKARVIGEAGYRFSHLIVDPEVEDSVHHTRHGRPCTASHRYKQRIFLVAKFFPADFLHLFEVLEDLALDISRDHFSVFVITDASLSRDSKSLRNRHTQVCHLRKVCTLAPEKLSHIPIAL